MSASPAHEDDIELVPVPMNRETRARLAAFARAVGDHPTHVAASLLHDLVRDDEFANINVLAGGPTLN